MNVHENATAGIIPACAAILIWGTTFVSTKVLLTDFSPLEILLVRFVTGYAALCVLAPRPLRFLGRRSELLLAAAGLCGCTLYQLLENQALMYTQASNVSIVVSSAPLFTALCAHFFLHRSAEKLSICFFAGFVLAIIGITMVSLNGDALQLQPAGDILAIICALFWAGYSIFTGKVNELHIPVLHATRRMYFYALVSLIPFCAVFGVNMDSAVNATRFTNVENCANLLYLGVGASALCFALWNKALKTIGVVKATSAIYAIPAVTMLCAAIVLHEPITIRIIIGAALIATGLILSQKNTTAQTIAHCFSPDEVIFAVTSRCNLHCAHCFVRRDPYELSAADAVTFLDSCATNGITKVGFTGGEPMMRYDFVAAVCSAAVDRDMIFDRLMTNGVFTDDESEMKFRLQKIYDAGFDGKIGLSFDDFHGQTPNQIISFLHCVFSIWGCRDCVEILSVVPAAAHESEHAKQEHAFLEKLSHIASSFGGSVTGKTNPRTGCGVLVICTPQTKSTSAVIPPLYIPVIRFAQSQSNAQSEQWTDKKWFTDDYCESTGNVLYVHTNGRVAPCCGFANENSALLLGSIQDGVPSLITSASHNIMIRRCFESGLNQYRKQLQNAGTLLPGITADMCRFCNWACNHTESANPRISDKM